MEQKQKRYFKYKFTKTMLALAFGAILLCLAGLVISIYRLSVYGVHGFTEALQSPLLIAICLFCIATILSILAKSQYVVDEEYYTTQFGFIKSKFLIKDVTSMVLDNDTKKLTLYVGEQYSVLSLAPEWTDEFIKAIREVKPDIEFSFTMAENKEEK